MEEATHQQEGRDVLVLIARTARLAAEDAERALAALQDRYRALEEAARELADLVDDAVYTCDSLTTQPVRAALAKGDDHG